MKARDTLIQKVAYNAPAMSFLMRFCLTSGAGKAKTSNFLNERTLLRSLVRASIDHTYSLAFSRNIYILYPEIFARILFSQIALKDILAAIKSRLLHDLPISVIDRVISPLSEDFIFAKLRICENKTFAKITEFTVVWLALACLFHIS